MLGRSLGNPTEYAVLSGPNGLPVAAGEFEKRMSRQVGVIDAQEWVAGEDRLRSMGAYNALPGASTRKLALAGAAG